MSREKLKMFYVSEIMKTIPVNFKTPLQEMTFNALTALKISFERVETDEAVTMDDCVEINEKLNVKMVKTLFLYNNRLHKNKNL